MAIDLAAAERFVAVHARVLERHLFAALAGRGHPGRVRATLRGYRNDDGGFGRGLDPDLRGTGSEPAAVLRALEVLAGIDALDDPMTEQAADWLFAVSEPAAESGDLTFALAGALWQAGLAHPWLHRATDWCWTRLDGDSVPAGDGVRFALDFLDSVPDPRRAADAVRRLRPVLAAGGTGAGPVELSRWPDSPSRALFTAEQIEADLDRLERAQGADGGWSPGTGTGTAGFERRGIATVEAVRTLAANRRLAPSMVRRAS